MARSPAAFFSYVQLNDKHDNGRLSELRQRLEREVEVHTGEKFQIFQDRNDLAWGQAWKERIEDALDASTFLIVIVTPGYLKSPACRKEFERFRNREAKLGRDDLILPLLYVDTPALTDELKRAADPIALEIARRQRADWRDLRFEPWTSPDVGKRLATLATMLRDAADRGGPVTLHPAGGARAQKAVGPVGTGSEGQSDVGEGRRGPSPRIEPPTLVVDPMPGRGDHTTIGSAIAAAPAGGRIFVRRGLYKESLVIAKPIEIIGDGPREEIIVEAVGQDVVLFNTDFGRIANLTLRQAGGGSWYGIDIAQGRPEIEDCDISSQSLACAAIHDGADPRLRRNRIHDGLANGVAVYDNGKGTIEDNEITGNKLAGVGIITGGDPVVRRNRIHDGLEAGVIVYDNGKGTIEDNEIAGNKLAGVAIKTGGDPVVRRNRIHDAPWGGVHVYDHGKGTIEDNEIAGNKRAGVEIWSGGDPVVRRNRIHEGPSGGVYVHDNGEGTIEDNEIVSNAHGGPVVNSGS